MEYLVAFLVSPMVAAKTTVMSAVMVKFTDDRHNPKVLESRGRTLAEIEAENAQSYMGRRRQQQQQKEADKKERDLHDSQRQDQPREEEEANWDI